MRTVSGKRFDDRVSRLALLLLFIFCIVGFLLGIVFIYLNVNDRISKLEQKIFPGSSRRRGRLAVHRDSYSFTGLVQFETYFNQAASLVKNLQNCRARWNLTTTNVSQ